MGWGVGRTKIDMEASDDDDVENNNDHDDSTTVEDDRLWVVMVPHVVVGELVTVRIFRNFKSYSEADLVTIVEASPHRVEPRCALAGVCGGCQYQHMSIEAQRDWKTTHVQEVLLQQQIQGYCNEDESKMEVLVLPTMGTEEVYEYRSKITPHYQAPREVGVDTYEMDAIGFQQSSNRILVDVPECIIATSAINQKYKETREVLLQRAKEGLLNQQPNKKKKGKRGRQGGDKAKGATLLFRQADDHEGESVVVTDHTQYMTTTVKDLSFRYLAGNFFQNNNYVLPLMVDAVVHAATQPTTSGNKPSYLIDCYCGSGLFALSAASKFDLCVGIELNKKAIEEATANAQLNGIANCQFVAASAEAIFTSPPRLEVEGYEHQEVQTFPREDTVVVLDPPRKGCSTEFLEQLYEYSPQRIVYMSCGPATQARDAKGIVEIGGYEIVSIQPFDLFPQTKHVECLIVFEKKQE
jgi:23S rRNA (uracil1939-C5)-methyltransferase/tRNA (uracil-5-)-methyltransferase